MKLKGKLTPKQFIVSNLLILLAGLIFLGGLYYILNVQYKISSNPFLNGPVTSIPKTLRLDLDQPDDESLTYSNSVIVSGQTSPVKEVLIFTELENLVLTAKKDGSFSTVLNLSEGENKITTVVFDANGDTKVIERLVYYSKEKL